MAYSIFKEKTTHYQFAGWSGILKKDYNMCLANKFQLMHWILHNAGYSCSVAQIIERCGIFIHSDRTLTMRYNDQNKQLQDTLNVISECCIKLLKIKQEERDDKRTGIEK